MDCARCATALPGGARFCLSCGAQVLAPSAERKLATILFADIVGSTELTRATDPEQMRATLDRLFGAAREIIVDHGGVVEKFIGDAVMAVFGAPVAHGDDPERAVRAGSALLACLADVTPGLALRIGVETGEVLATGTGTDLTVTGDAANAAARLEQNARPGQLLVGARAAAACRSVALVEVEAVAGKGFAEPLRAWTPATVATSTAPPAAPLVGRGDELALLNLIQRRAVREHLPQLVLVLGDAGVGKSRLCSEFREGLGAADPAPAVLVGRSLPYGAGLTFWALGEILRGAAGVDVAAPAQDVYGALVGRLERLGEANPEEVAGPLAATLGHEHESRAPTHGDAVPRAWRRLVRVLATERPLVLVLEDIHWADDALVDLVESLPNGVGDAPLTVIALARPDFLDRRPSWGRGVRNATTAELLPLRGEEAVELARSVLPGATAGLAADVATRAAGNPFFIEEIARNMGPDADGADRERLPDTVQATIAARLDLLPAEEKALLQHAAVLGQSFDLGGLRHLDADGGPDPASLIADLERRTLVREGRGTAGDTLEFCHALIRDVAYAGMPRALRADLHDRAAEWIARIAGPRHPELIEIESHHRLCAAGLGPTAERRRAAATTLLDAATMVSHRGVHDRGQRLAEEAAALDVEPALRIEALMRAAAIAVSRLAGDDAARLYDAAAEAAQQAGEGAVAVRALTAAVTSATRWAGMAVRHDPMGALAARLDRAERLAPPDDEAAAAQIACARSWLIRAAATEAGGRPASLEPAVVVQAEEQARRAHDIAVRTGDVILLSSSLDSLCNIALLTGRLGEANRLARERLGLLRHLHVVDPLGSIEHSDTLSMASEAAMAVGDLTTGLEYAEHYRRVEDGRGLLHNGLIPLIQVAFLLGRWGEAMSAATAMRRHWEEAGSPLGGYPVRAILDAATIAGLRRQGDEDDWMEWADRLAERWGPVNSQRRALHLGTLAIHRGRLDEACSVLDAATGQLGGWLNGRLAAASAEAHALAGHPGAAAAASGARALIDEDRLADGILLRVEGRLGDRAALDRSLAQLRDVGARYQAALTGLLLGGEERDVAERTMAELGVAVPAGSQAGAIAT